MSLLAVARRTRSRPPSPSPHDDMADVPTPPHPILPPLSSIPIPDTSTSTFHLEDGADRLEIILPTDTIILRSTGTHMEQTEFSGIVVLNLPSAMAIKSLTLTLSGKSKIPSPPGWDGPGDVHSPRRQSYEKTIVFTHDWSFLQGSSTVRTLKAGRNEFPFSAMFDGTDMPSSLDPPGQDADLLVRPSIMYRLRATAERPGLSTNLKATRCVGVIRSFVEDALEYQQTQEVESVWPDKVMYNMVVPHKTWAAGDSLATLYKFSPLRKGTRVTSIETALQEKASTRRVLLFVHANLGGEMQIKKKWRSSDLEDTRIVKQIRHKIVNGQPVLDTSTTPTKLSLGMSNFGASASRISLRHPASTSDLRSAAAASSSTSRSRSRPGTAPSGSGQRLLSPVATPAIDSSHVPRLSLSPAGEGREEEDVDIDFFEPSIDLSFVLLFPLPRTLLPTTPLSPVVISYRIRWIITILNPEGHDSQLKCSLPIHILHPSLFRESWAATKAVRRVILGENGDWLRESGLVDEDDEGLDERAPLPAYRDHILDRVPVSVHLHDLGITTSGSNTTALNPLRSAIFAASTDSLLSTSDLQPTTNTTATPRLIPTGIEPPIGTSYAAIDAMSMVYLTPPSRRPGMRRSPSMPDVSEMGRRRARRAERTRAETLERMRGQEALMLDLDDRRGALIDLELLMSLGHVGMRNVFGSAGAGALVNGGAGGGGGGDASSSPMGRGGSAPVSTSASPNVRSRLPSASKRGGPTSPRAMVGGMGVIIGATAGSEFFKAGGYFGEGDGSGPNQSRTSPSSSGRANGGRTSHLRTTSSPSSIPSSTSTSSALASSSHPSTSTVAASSSGSRLRQSIASARNRTSPPSPPFRPSVSSSIFRPSASSSRVHVDRIPRPSTSASSRVDSDVTSGLLTRTVTEEDRQRTGQTDLRLLNELYSTVPDYDTAARGFLGGGVTPLTTMIGLPGYAEVDRHRLPPDTGVSGGSARAGILVVVEGAESVDGHGLRQGEGRVVRPAAPRFSSSATAGSSITTTTSSSLPVTMTSVSTSIIPITPPTKHPTAPDSPAMNAAVSPRLSMDSMDDSAGTTSTSSYHSFDAELDFTYPVIISPPPVRRTAPPPRRPIPAIPPSVST